MDQKLITSFSILLYYIPIVSVLLQFWFYPSIISNVLYPPKFSLERNNDDSQVHYRETNSLKKLFVNVNTNKTNTGAPVPQPLEFDNHRLAECKQYYSSFAFPFLMVSVYIPLTIIGIILMLCIIIIIASCFPKEKNDFNMTELTNKNAITEKDYIKLLASKESGLSSLFASIFSLLLFSSWGLCSPAYSVLFRKGYNYFSSCADSMPKDSMIYKDFSKLRDDFSYYSVLCGIGAFIVYLVSALIIINCFMCTNMVISQFFISFTKEGKIDTSLRNETVSILFLI